MRRRNFAALVERLASERSRRARPMTSTPIPELDPAAAKRLSAMGDGAPQAEEKLQWLSECRRDVPQLNEALDRILLGEVYRYHGGLTRAREAQEHIKELLDRLTTPPWQPAVFLGAACTTAGPAALVASGSSRRVVQLNDGVSLDALSAGDEVFLTKDLNAIVARSESNSLRAGDVAAFDRYTADGRLVLNTRDEETIVDAAARLAAGGLKSGDLVRWDRAMGMAFELVERSGGHDIFLEDTPAETFADIGGLERQIEELQRAVLMRFRHGAVVAKYGLKPKRSVLLWGPPGTGKTMLARALANQLSAISPSGRARFASIKPGSLNSVWFGQTERNYREVFRAARAAGERDPDIPVVLYFDEVDSVGAARSDVGTRVDDRVLTAFMAELDGLEARGNVMVVASTNRRAALDPGLTRPGRLGDCVIHVPAPGRKAARAVLAKHLRTDVPFARNGHGADTAATREEILDAAIARLFAPNGDSDLAVMMFRDGKRREVKSRDLVSGAVLAKIANAAVELAAIREAYGGLAGVRLDDVVGALDAEMESAARVLTPANCRAYLIDLPQDVDVVSVQMVERKVPRPERYLAQR
jgi:proteasome-associated ATPase